MDPRRRERGVKLLRGSDNVERNLSVELHLLEGLKLSPGRHGDVNG